MTADKMQSRQGRVAVCTKYFLYKKHCIEHEKQNKIKDISQSLTPLHWISKYGQARHFRCNNCNNEE